MFGGAGIAGIGNDKRISRYSRVLENVKFCSKYDSFDHIKNGFMQNVNYKRRENPKQRGTNGCKD